MAKIQVRRYWKRYLTKARYRCEAYYIYVPRRIAQEFLNMELSVRKVGPFIVIVPQDIEVGKQFPSFYSTSKDDEGVRKQVFQLGGGI
jgi:hypothetical protein